MQKIINENCLPYMEDRGACLLVSVTGNGEWEYEHVAIISTKHRYHTKVALYHTLLWGMYKQVPCLRHGPFFRKFRLPALHYIAPHFMCFICTIMNKHMIDVMLMRKQHRFFPAEGDLLRMPMNIKYLTERGQHLVKYSLNFLVPYKTASSS